MVCTAADSPPLTSAMEASGMSSSRTVRTAARARASARSSPSRNARRTRRPKECFGLGRAPMTARRAHALFFYRCSCLFEGHCGERASWPFQFHHPGSLCMSSVASTTIRDCVRVTALPLHQVTDVSCQGTVQPRWAGTRPAALPTAEDTSTA